MTDTPQDLTTLIDLRVGQRAVLKHGDTRTPFRARDVSIYIDGDRAKAVQAIRLTAGLPSTQVRNRLTVELGRGQSLFDVRLGANTITDIEQLDIVINHPSDGAELARWSLTGIEAIEARPGRALVFKVDTIAEPAGTYVRSDVYTYRDQTSQVREDQEVAEVTAWAEAEEAKALAEAGPVAPLEPSPNQHPRVDDRLVYIGETLIGPDGLDRPAEFTVGWLIYDAGKLPWEAATAEEQAALDAQGPREALGWLARGADGRFYPLAKCTRPVWTPSSDDVPVVHTEVDATQFVEKMGEAIADVDDLAERMGITMPLEGPPADENGMETLS